MCQCPTCERVEDLFVEELVEATGLDATLPEMLWAATPDDVQGIEPCAVYFYDWEEIDENQHLLDPNKPTINLGVGGVYQGRRREQLAFDIYDYLKLRASLSS